MEEDRFIRLGKILSLSFIVISLFLWAFSFKNLPPEIPLFYSRPWGEEQLANPFFLLILPGASFLVFLSSAFIYRFTEEKLLTYLMVYGAVLFSFFSLFTIVKIILLVI